MTDDCCERNADYSTILNGCNLTKGLDGERFKVSLELYWL